MKRKRRPGKMTYSELVEALHMDLAKHVMWQRQNSIHLAKQGHHGHMKKNIPLDRRFLIP